MGITKNIGVKIIKQENGIEVLETKFIDRPQLCKNCGKNSRTSGSSRCKECTTGYKMTLFNMERLNKKVEDQAKLLV